MMFFQCVSCKDIFLLHMMDGGYHPSCPMCGKMTMFLKEDNIKSIINKYKRNDRNQLAKELENMLEIKTIVDTLERIKGND